MKYKDPGCPTISVNIEGTCGEKALLDLGASVNLLPYSVYKQLGLGELKPTTITLSLVDRSVKIHKGTIEDVLVYKFYYPVDFVVLDMKPVSVGANYVPIILGRPFLATSNAIINCPNGVMQLTFGNMTLEINIFHLSKKHVHLEGECLEEVCLIDTIVEEQCEQLQSQVELIEELAELPEILDEPSELCAAFCPWKKKEEILPLLIDKGKENGEPLKLDLKPLPIELKYAYLEEGDQCPVVIALSLNVSQEDDLLGILRKCK